MQIQGRRPTANQAYHSASFPCLTPTGVLEFGPQAALAAETFGTKSVGLDKNLDVRTRRLARSARDAPREIDVESMDVLKTFVLRVGSASSTAGERDLTPGCCPGTIG